MEIDNEYVVLCTSTTRIEEDKELGLDSIFALEMSQSGLEIMAECSMTSVDDMGKIKKLIIKKDDIKVIDTDDIDDLVKACREPGVKCVYSNSLGYRISNKLLDKLMGLSKAEKEWLAIDQFITRRMHMRTLSEIERDEVRKWKMRNSCTK